MKQVLHFLRKITPMLALAVMMMAPGMGWGQILTETFNEATTSSTTGGTGMPNGGYSTGSYVLSSGTWVFLNAIRGTANVNSNPGCQIQSATGNNIITPTIATGGVGTVSFYAAGTSAGAAVNVSISINGGDFNSGTSFTGLTTTSTLKTLAINDLSANIRVKFTRTAGTLTLDDISITAPSGSAPPTLNAAASANVDTPFEITFTDDPTWRNAITVITYDGTTVAAGAYDKTQAGKITFTPSLSVALQTAKTSKNIVITSTGYTGAILAQTIGFGAATKLGMKTQPAAPATNGAALATQPAVYIQDQYGNTTTSTAIVATAVGSGSWSLGGTATVGATAGTSTFSGLTATSTAAVTGATISFTSTGLTGVTSSTFNIPAPAPANDNCSGAIALTVNASAISGDVSGATQTLTATCVGNANDDVWYSFTTSVAGNYTITVVGSSSFDAVVDLRSGTCNGTNILCADVTTAGGTETISATGLLASTTYNVRVYDYLSVVPATTTFTIAVGGPIDPPVATAATNVTSTGFSANWNNISGATGYRLDVATTSNFTIGSPVTVVSQGFNNNAPNFSVSGGTYYTGNSAAGDRPATSPFAIEGTHSYGVSNASAALTSNAFDLSNYTLLQMSLRVAAFSIGSTGNGMDDGDLVTVEISPDNGANYYSTARINGNSNAYWAYSTGVGNALTAYDGDANPVDFQAGSGGGNQTTNGYSTITVTNLPSSSNFKVRITLLSNNTAERWVIDDFKISGTLSSMISGYNNLTVVGLTQPVSGLSSNTNYYYRVRAVASASTSANSNVISVTTSLPVYNLLGADDVASNYSTWVNTSNEGCGFGAWSLISGGNAGFFLGDPSAAGITMTNPAFALYANTTGTDFANADRVFAAPMPVASTLSVDWGVNWDANGSGNKGINLYTGGVSGTQVVNINMGGSDAITINSNPMFSNYGAIAMTLNFEYVSAGQLRVYGTGRDGSEVYDQTIAVSAAPDVIRFYASGLNTGDQRQPYFNNLKIVTDPTGIPVVSSVFVKGCVSLADDLEVGNLTIETGNSLQINAASGLTINGALTNDVGNAGLVIENGGSLIHSSSNVPATVKRTIPGVDEAWHLLSSPVASQDIAPNFTPTGTYGDNTGYDFYAWDEPTAMWLNQKDGNNGITTFVPGKGYLVAYQVPDTKTFTGNLNNGDVAFTLKNSGGAGAYIGSNLMGNPYASGIDWNLADRSSFADNFAYVYNAAKLGGEGYVNVDGNSAASYIGVNQGFMVLAKSTENDATFNFTNAMRAHGGSYMKSTNATDQLKVRFANATNYDETSLRLSDESDFIRDRNDAVKMFSYNPAIPQVYTLTSDLVSASINTIPSISEEAVFPLGLYVPTEDNYVISLPVADGEFAGRTVYLEDKLIGSLVNLSDIQTYAFAASPSDNTNRFVLKFSTLGINNPTATDGVQVYAYGEVLYVATSTKEAALVNVYNLTGQLVMQGKTGGNALTTLNASALGSGIYVVNVVLNNGVVSRKVVIRK